MPGSTKNLLLIRQQLSLRNADIDLMVGATYDNILMVEGEMKEVSEAEMLQALKIAHDTIKIHCKAQMEFAEEVGCNC